MKTNVLKLLFVTFLLVCVANAKAHDFEVDGIYYKVTSTENLTVEVTCKGTNYYDYYNEYSGEVVILEKVNYNGKTYSVTSIGWNAFAYCSGLTSVTIPNSVTSIGRSAFDGCGSLTSVTIPNSVTSIGYAAFNNCSSLTSIIVDSGNMVYDSRDNCNAIIATATNTLVVGCKNSVIPNSVTSIENKAFCGCSDLTSVTIPNSVTSIGYAAFYDCSGLTSVIIPNSVTSIGYAAFYDCNGLTSVIIPNSVTSIGERAFESCSGLTSVTIGNSVASIGSSAFEYCDKLKTVINYSSLTIIKGLSSNGYVGYYADRVINAPNGTIEGDFVFRKNDGVNTLCGYIGNDTELTLPANYKGENYVIGDSVFYGYSGLTSITFSNSVTSIGERAFESCSGLTSVTIGNSVTSIGERAFAACNRIVGVYISDLAAWCNIDFNSSNSNPLTYAKNLYLNGILIKDLVVPNGVKDIKNYTFYNCSSLASITIPNSVTSIGSGAFNRCSGLKRVYISDLVAWCNIDFSSNPLSSAKNLYLNGILIKDLVVPNGVKNIKNSAFKGCSSLTSVTIPESVTSIGNSAFYGCSELTSVTIPESVTKIGESAFKGCTKLENITIPESVTSIGGSILDGTAWYENQSDGVVYVGKVLYVYKGEKSAEISIEIKNGTKVIAGDAFISCTGLASITIPSSVTSIGESAFEGCTNLTSITIPYSVTSIEDNAFYKCNNLKTVLNFSNLTLDKGLSQYGYVAYYADEVTNGSIEGDFIFADIDNVKTLCVYVGNNTTIVLPDNYKGKNYAIGNKVFKDCDGLTNITIPNSVTSIGNEAFSHCTELKSVTIGKNVTSICEDAFWGCTRLIAVYINDLSAWCNITFANEYSNPFYYAQYLSVNGKLLTNLVIPEDITEIKNYAFYGCNNLKNITITDNVTSIGNSTFSGCTGLSSITIPNSVTNIEDSTFSDCINLKSITIGHGVTNIGNEVFSGCDSISSLNINCKSIANWFAGKESIKEIVVGNSVTDIKNDAFNGCTGLTSVTLGNSIASIGDHAFYKCNNLKCVYINNLGAWCNIKHGTWSNPLNYAQELYLNGELLTDLVIPEDVTIISSEAFVGYGKLKSVTIPNSVTTIGHKAFQSCTNLENVNIGKNVKSIGVSAFRDCKNIKSITIPESAAVLENDAFYGCSALTSIYLANETPINIATTPFSNYDAILYVPQGTFLDYILNDFWGQFKNIVEYEVKKYFNINYIVDGEIYATDKVAFGDTITLIDAPTKDGYTFSGWSEAPAIMPAKDITIMGTFVLTGISEVSLDAMIKVSDNCIIINGATGSNIAVYSTSGALIEKFDSYAGEEITLDKGLYIINIGNNSMKIRL